MNNRLPNSGEGGRPSMSGSGMHPPPQVHQSAYPPPPNFGQGYSTNNNPPSFPPDIPPPGGQWYQGEAEELDDDDENGPVAEHDGPEGRDAKRRRIARACDACRRKKIKCDGKAPKCGHCDNYKTECIFTQVEKKRAPPKGAKYIEGLENRLGRMEGLLRLSGLLAADDGGRTDLGTLEKRLAERQTDATNASSPHQRESPAGPLVNGQGSGSRGTPAQDQQKTPDVGAVNSPRPVASTPGDPKQDPKEVDALADSMCSLITNNAGETRYIGSSSGFSIFSPKGIQWVNQKTGDTSFQQMIATATSDEKMGWDHWKPEVFNDLFSRRIFKPLPGRSECLALLKDYFEHFNQMFPLFHEPTFMHLVDKHYSLEPYEGSGWWASLNVALAIAHRLRVMSNVVGQEEDEHAWGYLKNAMAVMTELTMRNTDLLSVQALLGMALFLQGTPNPQPSFSLVASAIRLAHSIGLHKRGPGFNLNEVESEQRKRVFWIAYLLDKDICLRSGRPPSQDEDDMNVELPSDDPPDNVGTIPLVKETKDGKKTMNLFHRMCTFAQIQSRVYKQLYSVKASRQSDGELLNTIGELDAQLEAWKDSIPIDFRPEHEINAAHTPLILHVVCLHFGYYNCLTTIHRMSVHHGYWTSRLSDYALQGLNARPLNPRVFMSAALCVNAARTSIGLIRYIPQGDYACVWLVLYYPVSSLVTLFANILQNPQDARARSDLRLMSSVVAFLTMLEGDVVESNGNVRRMLSVCSEFERIAKVVLDKAERDMRSGRSGKRKAAGGPTEREKDKALRERGDAEVQLDTGLAQGKTLEQMQVETQAGYRRPIQTSSMRASLANSQQGSQANSPASWGGSQVGGVGQEYRSPPAIGQPPRYGPEMTQTSSGAVQYGNGPQYNLPNSLASGNFASNFNGNTASPPPPRPGNFNEPQPALTSGFNGGGTGFTNQQLDPQLADLDFGTPNNFGISPGGTGADGSMGGFGGTNGSFQQPFVPQDLWQMPMTLEWDWAEGLGLGAFTPGAMGMGSVFDGPNEYLNFGAPQGGHVENGQGQHGR